MPKASKPSKNFPKSFAATDEDRYLIEVLGKKLGQDFSGLIRYMLRRTADAEGIELPNAGRVARNTRKGDKAVA
jgi:hypothetical protein